MVAHAKVKNETRHPRQKYCNHAQLVQGVGLVNEPTLEWTDRLFLNCLAAHNVKTDPHPGNKKLMRWCGVTSRQGINGVSERVLAKKLAEVVTPGGGRNHATVYRIRVEDDRFPWPEDASKPATPDLPFSRNKPASHKLRVSPKEPATVELPVSKNKPATGKAETRNSQPLNPQLDPAKPATLELHPDLNAGYKHGFNHEENRAFSATKERVATAPALAAPAGRCPHGTLLYMSCRYCPDGWASAPVTH
jgi:hypothetical protein